MPTDEQVRAMQGFTALFQEGFKGAGQRGITYLTLTNGGAAVACVAFMGSGSEYSDSLALRILLLIFVTGLFLVGAIIVGEYSTLRAAMLDYSDKVEACRAGKASYSEVESCLRKHHRKLQTISRFNKVFGYSSFAMFFAGALIACVWLLASM